MDWYMSGCKVAIIYPETYLHPSQQVDLGRKFADLAVECIGVTFVIVTQSPYMLNALEVYAKKLDLVFWHVNNDMITEMNDTDPLYQELANPFQVLRNDDYKIEEN
jgi:predicted ATPase